MGNSRMRSSANWRSFLFITGIVAASSAQAQMGIDWITEKVASGQCPTVLTEYEYVNMREVCPALEVFTNETIREADACRSEVSRQNDIITRFNYLVRRCVQQAESARRAANNPMPEAPAPQQTYSPSFDCDLASTSTERAICASESLSQQDRSMSVSYKQLRERSPAPDAVRQRQREWVRERDSCGAEESCIGASYEYRLGEIGDEMDMVANDEMHADQQPLENDFNSVHDYEPEQEWTQPFQEPAYSSAPNCADVPAIQQELYDRSCMSPGDGDCYYSIIQRLSSELGIQCVP